MKTTLALILTLAACGSSAKPPVPPAQPDRPVAADSKQLEQVAKNQKVSPNLSLSGDIVKLCNITAGATANPSFDYNKDELTPEDRVVLDQLAVCLTKGPLKDKAVSLIGRADPRGTEEYNLGLGSRRSNSVATYLERLGVHQVQLYVTTRGSLDATGTDEASWQQDRRVDVQLKTS